MLGASFKAPAPSSTTSTSTVPSPRLPQRIHPNDNARRLNSALMTSQHAPYRGGKPYGNMRVWVLRDGRWQLALSQQVTIQSAGSLSAVASTQ